jgi:hypothetical protein
MYNKSIKTYISSKLRMVYLEYLFHVKEYDIMLLMFWLCLWNKNGFESWFLKTIVNIILIFPFFIILIFLETCNAIITWSL